MAKHYVPGLFLLILAAPMLAAAAPFEHRQVPQSLSGGVQLAALFGESDEEKEARLRHEDDQDLAVQALTQRVHDLEASLRQVTGQNEALSHRVQELNDKLDREQKDFEYRLCAMAAQQLGATPGQAGQPAENGLPCSPGGPSQAAAPPPSSAASPGGGQQGKPPGSLGTLSQHDALPLGPAATPQASSQFDSAMNLLSKAQYDEARAAFRGFADANPKDARTPQAVYWIGRIAYVQKDYAGAARAFAEEVKKYPTNANAPESMIKLGESLIAMGQKKEGCTALAALRSKYPSASKSLLAKASATRKSFCRPQGA